MLHPTIVDKVRGWAGHRREAKWFFAVAGEFNDGVVAPDEWRSPSRTLTVVRYSLTVRVTAVLEIPLGHFTAIVAGTDGTALIVFSTGTIATAKDDDCRLPADYWPMVPVAKL